jgi:SEC-C motif-containing protein
MLAASSRRCACAAHGARPSPASILPGQLLAPRGTAPAVGFSASSSGGSGASAGRHRAPRSASRTLQRPPTAAHLSLGRRRLSAAQLAPMPPPLAAARLSPCRRRRCLSIRTPLPPPPAAVAPRARPLAAAPKGKGFGSSPTPAKSKAPEADTPCPCGSGAAYGACCGPRHAGTATAESPEALLRARFTAYANEMVEYIADTTHPESPEFTGSRQARAGAIGGLIRGAQMAASAMACPVCSLPPPDAQLLSPPRHRRRRRRPPQAYLSQVRATSRRAMYRRLELHGGQQAGANADEAFLSFTAYYHDRDERPGKDGNRTMQSRRERSRFVRDRATGRWAYFDSSFEAQPAGLFNLTSTI